MVRDNLNKMPAANFNSVYIGPCHTILSGHTRQLLQATWRQPTAVHATSTWLLFVFSTIPKKNYVNIQM